ncbi:MAG: phage tail protein [Candidatus Thiodiazotropha endolucinida]
MPDNQLPLLNNRFTVNIDSSRPDCSRKDVAFSSISGISSSGYATARSSSLSKLLGFFCRDTKANRIELCRALDSDHFFFDWHQTNLCRVKDLRTLTICMLEPHTDKPVNCWRLYDCWIETWRGPNLDAMNAGPAYETLTLCYRSLCWLQDSDLK